jgi:hypothetical protein
VKRTPLQRRTRLRSRRPTARRSERVRDLDYMDRVRALPCAARDLSPCSGPIEADHAAKKRGMGSKCNDDDTIPLCSGHHSARHGFQTPFRAWTAPTMRAWLDEQIAATRATIDAARSVAP